MAGFVLLCLFCWAGYVLYIGATNAAKNNPEKTREVGNVAVSYAGKALKAWLESKTKR